MNIQPTHQHAQPGPLDFICGPGELPLSLKPVHGFVRRTIRPLETPPPLRPAPSPERERPAVMIDDPMSAEAADAELRAAVEWIRAQVAAGREVERWLPGRRRTEGRA